MSIAEDEGDARVRRATLTDEGARVLSQALELWHEVQREVEEEFGQQRLRSLYGELAALSGAVQR